LHDYSLELPLHSSTIIHELRELSRILVLRNDLEKEREEIKTMDEEDLNLKILQVEGLVESLQGNLLDVHQSQVDKTNSYKGVYCELEDNYQNILKSNFVVSKDAFPKNERWQTYLDVLENLKISLIPILKWYRNVVAGATEVLLKQNRSWNIARALDITSSNHFSTKSCEEAIEALSLNIYNPKSFKVTHLSDLRKAVAANERRLATLEFLQDRLNDHKVDIGQFDLQEKDGLLFECCALYILSDLSKLAHQHRNGMGIKAEMTVIYGEDWQLVFESLEILHESDLLRSPETNGPDFDLTTILVTSSIASILYLQKLYQREHRKSVLRDTTIDQLEYFERIQSTYLRFTILLAKEILPRCIKASFGNNPMVFSLMNHLIELRKVSEDASTLEKEKLIAKAQEVMVSFEDLETTFATDSVCLGILESIQNIIQELQNVKMKFVSNLSKQSTFLKLMVLLGTMFEEGKEFIAKSSLSLADPTGEYANIADIFQIILHSDFKKTQKEFTSFMGYLREEFYYKPYFAVVECIIDSITSRLNKRYSKGWNTNPQFDENTQIPWVDLANKYLNCFLRLGTLQFDELVPLKEFAIKNGMAEFVGTIRSRAESKIEFVKKAIESQQVSLEKYQLLHATDLFENSNSIGQFSKRTEFLQTLESAIGELVQLNSTFDELLETETDAEIKATLTEQTKLHLDLHKFCTRLRDCEKERLPDEQMVEVTKAIVMDLEHLCKLNRRFGSVETNKSKELILAAIEEELSQIHTKETIKVLKQLLKKLVAFFDSLKKVVDPIIRIADSVVTNAKDTPFNSDIQKRMMV
jgi:hypothetical protein